MRGLTKAGLLVAAVALVTLPGCAGTVNAHRLAVDIACGTQLAALGLQASQGNPSAIIEVLAAKAATGEDVSGTMAACAEAFANVGMDLAAGVDAATKK
jgi:hypothetical protein